MSYTVTEDETPLLTASLDAVSTENQHHLRYLDITVRVGTPKLDNYRVVQGERARFTSGSIIPIDDVGPAINRKLWLDTDRTYHLAARRLIEIKSNKEVQLQQGEDSDDFS